MKSLQPRKTGKEGASCDQVAETFSGAIVAAALRQRGSKTLSVIQDMLQNLDIPEGLFRSVGITQDRGYNTPDVVQFLAEK